MPHLTPRATRVLVAIAIAVSASLPIAALPHQVAEAATVQRVSGSDRFATAAAISKSMFARGVAVAYVTTGSTYPDALAGAALAAKHRAPVLLVSRNDVPAPTATELARLQPKRIVVLGGTAAVSASVANRLDAYTAGAVSRLSGADRYATAVAVSRAWGRGVNAVYVVTGASFPDALAASAVAARGGFPVLLVGRNDIPDVVARELARLAPKRIFVAGGPGVVSEGVRAALARYTAGPVERVAGNDRYATAAAISRRHFGSADFAYVATGASFPDALAAAPVAGLRRGPVLLTTGTSLSRPAANELARLSPERAVIVGGTSVVSNTVASAVNTVLAGPVASSPTARPSASPTPKPSTSTAPRPTASPTPRPTATPAPPAATVPSRCPIGMPTAAPAGWRRVTTSTFSETTPLGRWPGPIAATAWQNRAAGAKDSSGRGTYDSSRTVSEANGMLDIWIHSEKEGVRGVHDPSGQRYVAAIVSKLGPTNGARISVCMRADVIPGYKLAYLLWPSEGTGNSLGEIDFPEGKLTGLPATAKAFMHYAPKPSSGKMQDWYDTGVAMQGWHVYTVEWNPKASPRYAKFYLDGRLIGHSTNYVPWVTMRFIMQHETFMANQALPAPAQGHVQVDWATIDLPN